jgi:hypothetical protein
MKTTLALAVVVGLVVTLSAAAATGGETPKTAPPSGTAASGAPAKDTVTEQDIRELAAHYFANGVQAYTAGDLESARSDLQAAVTLDPTNAKAKSMLQIVEQKLGITDKTRLKEKLQARVTNVEFTNAPVKDVVDFLAREAQINIVFDASALQLLGPAGEQAQQPPANTEEQPETKEAEAERELPPIAPPEAVRAAPPRTDLITIHLKNVPLGEVLKYVLRFKGLKYVVEDYAILIVPVDWAGDGELVTEIFRLQTSGAAGQEIYERLGGDTGSQRTQGY